MPSAACVRLVGKRLAGLFVSGRAVVRAYGGPGPKRSVRPGVQYSSAIITVRTRWVTAGSAGSSEPYLRSES